MISHKHAKLYIDAPTSNGEYLLIHTPTRDGRGVVVYNMRMSRATKKHIPPLVGQRMVSMYTQGYSVRTIAEVTEFQVISVRAHLINENVFDQHRGIIIAPPKKPGKYDHLFEEKKAQGRMYVEYKKK